MVKHFLDADEIVRAVDEVTLVVEPGQLSALYGPSGSGKTTLLLLAAGLLAPDHGCVRFAGTDLGTLSRGGLVSYQRREVGFVYQAAHLMSGVPALENAAIKLLADKVPLKHARTVASEWLDQVGLSNRLAHTPERLSAGERQRVAIARALSNDPRLILADEPTGNLDSRRGLQILRLLAELARERNAAVLLATHDERAAMVADRVWELRDGKLSDGDASALRSARAARG